MRKLSYQGEDPKLLKAGDPFTHAGQKFVITEPYHCSGLLLARKPEGKKVYMFDIKAPLITELVGVLP